ncbi:MAG: hypothetical protein ACYCSF_12425 [Acidimicrobiales bacterium]
MATTLAPSPTSAACSERVFTTEASSSLLALPGRRLFVPAIGSFGPCRVHDVGCGKADPSVNIHAYSSPLTLLTMHDAAAYCFVARDVVPDERRGTAS